VAVKTRIASRPSTALPVREMILEAAPPALSPSSLTGSYRVSDPSSLPDPETSEEEEGESPLPRHRCHNALEYSEDDRPELEVRETQRHTTSL
jgi:hypothetical protein